MIPSPTLRSIASHIAKDSAPSAFGLIFAPLGNQFSHEKIIPIIADWHFRTGNNLHVFFPGYSGWTYSSETGIINLDERGTLQYSPQDYHAFCSEVENLTSWRRSGDVELMLLKTPQAASEKVDITNAEESFRLLVSAFQEPTLLLPLQTLSNEPAGQSFESFMETIFAFFDNFEGTDPIGSLSDALGMNQAPEALRRLLSKVTPLNLSDEFYRLIQLRVRDIRNRDED